MHNLQNHAILKNKNKKREHTARQPYAQGKTYRLAPHSTECNPIGDTKYYNTLLFWLQAFFACKSPKGAIFMNKTEKAIYELLKKGVLFRDEKGIYTIFPQKLLIQASGKSERTIQYGLKSLENQKYIIRIMYQEVNLMKFYFLKEEDLTGLEIIDRSENCTPSLENDTSPLENCRPSLENCTPSLENDRSSSSNEDAKKNDDLNETLKELSIVKRALAPEKYFLPTFKPVGILFRGDFPVGQEKKIGMTSEKDKRSGKLAYIVLMLNFDELGDGVKISRELTVYDQQVWNACANLMKCGYNIITPTQIYRWMGYKKQLNTRDNQRILDSINTIIRARVSIDNRQERELYKKYPEISINEPLLAASICTAKSGKNEVTAIEILSMPKLFGIAEQRGQITAIPFEVMEIPVISKTDDNLQLLNYLVKRIVHMKHDEHTSRKILLNAIYEKCNIKEKKQKQRLPEKLEKILSYYKSIEWIKDHNITEQGIEIILSDKK